MHPTCPTEITREAKSLGSSVIYGHGAVARGQEAGARQKRKKVFQHLPYSLSPPWVSASPSPVLILVGVNSSLFLVIYHLLTDPQTTKFHFTHFIYLLAVLGFHGCVGFIAVVSLLQSPGSSVHRLDSCGTRALSHHSMWDLPRLGIKPVSSELADGFFITEPLEKPPFH